MRSRLVLAATLALPAACACAQLKQPFPSEVH